MLNLDPKLDSRLRAAIRQFWETRRKQAKKQGSATGTKDAGARAAVTGGAQMDGFVSLIGDLLREVARDSRVVQAGEEVGFAPGDRWTTDRQCRIQVPGGAFRPRSAKVLFGGQRDPDQVLLTKLVRERLYDSACFLMSDAERGRRGYYREPEPELNFQKFAASLVGRAVALSNR